jgi:hypothetical protein
MPLIEPSPTTRSLSAVVALGRRVRQADELDAATTDVVSDIDMKRELVHGRCGGAFMVYSFVPGRRINGAEWPPRLLLFSNAYYFLTERRSCWTIYR